MEIIVAGQRVVTALDLIEAAGLSPATAFEPENTEAVLAARYDAMSDFLDDLVDTADADDEDAQLDIAHYRQLLRRMPAPFRTRDGLFRRPAWTGAAA
ncbi:hypothetical protein ABZW10_36440 [Kitasatospora sp. NPDC004723]|uniref:hypothetical protein n=1 Tax=Kitasatospora sp. NPDC004723 TaxID=3154288 RepID=UPI00339DB1AF